MILMLIIWRSRALHPIRSTNTPMSRRSEKVLSNWEEVCKGIHFIGIFCSHKQVRPEVHHGLLRAGCFFWHNVFLSFLVTVTFILDEKDELIGHHKFLTLYRYLEPQLKNSSRSLQTYFKVARSLQKRILYGSCSLWKIPKIKIISKLATLKLLERMKNL